MSGENPLLVSFVIPHFNRAELLVETLDSLRAQSYPHWEAIVVDDGSEPGQWELAQQLSDHKIRVVARNQEPKGPSKCRNMGVELARGTHVVFIDSDDLVAPWCLDQRIEAIAKDPDLGFIVFPVMLFQNKMADSDLCWNELDADSDLDRFLRSDPPWHTSSPIWKRSTLIDIGGFNEAVMYGDDSDLHIRALLSQTLYSKIVDALPDVFVRRDESPRITNTISDDLIVSRLNRLREGSKALAGASPKLNETWEGQYFVEAEFLIFNRVIDAGSLIPPLLNEWRQRHHPPFLRRLIVRSYLRVANATRDRAYIILRIARRLAMKFLPPDYTPTGGTFHNTTVSAELSSQIKSRLSDSVSAS